MRKKDILAYIAAPCRIFMTILVLVVSIHIAQGFTLVALESLFRPAKRPAPLGTEEEYGQEYARLQTINRSQKEFFPDGTLNLVYLSERTAGRHIVPQRIQVYDANDRLLWEGQGLDRSLLTGFDGWSMGQYLSWVGSDRNEEGRNIYYQGLDQNRFKQMQWVNADFSKTLRVPLVDEGKVFEVWRYEPCNGYFAGFGAENERVGFLGPDGFGTSESATNRFGPFRYALAWCPHDSAYPVFLWQTQRCIYRIDFDSRETRLLFESPQSDIEKLQVRIWPYPPGSLNASQDTHSLVNRPMVHCTTADKRHHLIMLDTGEQVTVDLPDDWVGNSVRVTATNEGMFLQRQGNEMISYMKSCENWEHYMRQRWGKPVDCWVELYKIDDSGGLHLLNRYDWVRPGERQPYLVHRRFMDKYSICSISPPLYDLIVRCFGKKLYAFSRYADEPYRELAQAILELGPNKNTLNWPLSIVMVCVVMWHAWPRRGSWGCLVFWVVFVALFNLAGLLTYLALNHSVTIKCPACGKRRGIQKPACVRCGAQLPVPEGKAADLVLCS